MRRKRLLWIVAVALITAWVTGCGAGGEVVLTVSGAVEDELSLTMKDLEDMGAEEVTVEHPRDGEQMYEGVRIGKILDEAGPTGDTVTFTASDDYSVDIALSDLEACNDCLVAFDDEGLRLAMSGMEGKFWVKDVVKVEVQ